MHGLASDEVRVYDLANRGPLPWVFVQHFVEERHQFTACIIDCRSFVLANALVQLVFIEAVEGLSQGAELVQDYTEGPNVTLDCVRLLGLSIQMLRCKVKWSTDLRCVLNLEFVVFLLNCRSGIRFLAGGALSSQTKVANSNMVVLSQKYILRLEISVQDALVMHRKQTQADLD